MSHTKEKKKKKWSYSAGEWGRNRVRVYEDHKCKSLFLEFSEKEVGLARSRKKRILLGHRDKARAKQEADEAASKLGEAQPVRSPELALQTLFEMYLGEKTPLKSTEIQKQDKQQVELFLRCFGRTRKVRHLSVREWDRFKAERSSGRLSPPNGSGGPVSPRTVEKDLRFLTAVLNWASKVSDGNGGFLLDRNPLKGHPFPAEPNPRRPELEDRESEALLRVAPQIDWRFAVALVLAHETGHRIGAIRKLRWSDIDLSGEEITWRKENDKIGMEHSTPLEDATSEALQLAYQQNPGEGDAWVFPSPKDPSKPCSRHLMRNWWTKAEKLAGVKHRKGLGWHCFRRKWASECDALPMHMLCDMGGWRSHQTVIRCYQSARKDQKREALKLRRRANASG